MGKLCIISCERPLADGRFKVFEAGKIYSEDETGPDCGPCFADAENAEEIIEKED